MPANGGTTQLIFLVVIFAAMWFLLIRPQQQQQKRAREMQAALEPGAEIMTIGGIYATVVDVAEDRVRVRVADGSEFEIARRAVAQIVAGSGPELEDASAEGENAAGSTEDPGE